MTTISFQPYVPGTTDSEGNRSGSIDPRLSRTNYFDGQLLKASDLTRDQIYLDERLLEMGQVLGSGIIRGLDVELVKNHILRVSPGIAVAPSGRVLQLSGKTLEINLQDSGFIADLNKGRYRRFNRGLYAVALNYAEVVDGVSESYPADLASRRAWQVSSYAEGVELSLIPLNIPLQPGDSLALRAALAHQLIAADGRFTLPGDESIALGMIAIDQGRPLWLDLGLLRRPLRPPNTGNALQLDLAAHYQELFREVLRTRHAGGRNGDFAASQYFRRLPPFGPVPKDAIDPVSGRQSYFPRDYEVSIAPVRRADLPSLIEESARLAPMDMERDADADIMVLAPMSDQAFALRARQLEKGMQEQLPKINKLPVFNSLALRLFARPPSHLIDTDTDAWKAIWAEADPSELVYVRRPPRAAETNVSALVLARGFKLPDPNMGLPPDAASLEKQLDKALEESVNASADLAKKEKELAALKEQIKQLQKAVGANIPLQDALAQIQQLEAELEAAAAEIKSLQAGGQDASVFKVALQAATEKISALSAELDLAYKKIDQLQSGGVPADDTLQAKIKELTVALNEANDKAVKLAGERDLARGRVAELELKLKNLMAELEQLRQKLNEASSGATTGDADLSAAKEEIGKLNQKIDALEKQQQSLQAGLTKAQQAQAVAESDSKSATFKLAEALKQLQDSQTANTTSASDLARNKELIASLQAQLSGAEKKVAELQIQLAQRVLLRTAFPLVELAAMRGDSSTAAEKLESQIGDNADARLAVIHLLTLVPASFDRALWRSLVSVAQNTKNLTVLREVLLKSFEQGLTIPQAFLEHGPALGVTDSDVKVWRLLIT